MSQKAKLIGKMKCVIQREINLESQMCHSVQNILVKLNVSFSAKLIGEMKCVIQCKINLENEMCHSVQN